MRRLALLSSVLGLAAAGCHDQPPGHDRPPAKEAPDRAPARAPTPPSSRLDDPVVAIVGETPIRASALRARMAKHEKASTPRPVGLRPQAARQALDELVNEALVDAAVRQRHPAVEENLRRAMVHAFIRRHIDPELRKDRIPDAELRAIYNRSRKSFVHGRLVEVALLAVYTGERMRPEPRARAEEAARALAALVARRPHRTPEDFAEIAADPAWSARRVQYQTLLMTEDYPFSPAVGRPVQMLRRPGETTGLLSDQSGFFIARYVGERPAQNLSFEAVRDRLRDGYFERWRLAQFGKLMKDLGSGHAIEAFPHRLAVPDLSENGG